VWAGYSSIRVVVVLCVALAAMRSDAQATAASRFDYSRDAERVVVSYVELSGELAEPDSAPRLEIFGDGRARVRYPPTMKRAGEYEAALTQAELNDLLVSMVERKLVDFDADAVRARRRELVAQRRAAPSPDLFSISDDATVEIGLHLQRYRPTEPGAVERRDVSKHIRYRGLRSDARSFPELEEVQDLMWARDRLRALMHRPDLAPVTR
jgi:hypothetical protein